MIWQSFKDSAESWMDSECTQLLKNMSNKKPLMATGWSHPVEHPNLQDF